MSERLGVRSEWTRIGLRERVYSAQVTYGCKVKYKKHKERGFSFLHSYKVPKTRLDREG